MKRYTPMNDDSSGPVEWPDEDPHGEWVRHADAMAEIAAARRKLLLDLWDALPGHEASGDCAGSLRAMLLFSEVGDEIRKTRLGR